MFKEYYFQKSPTEVVQFEVELAFVNNDNGKSLVLCPRESILFIDHLQSNDGVNIICVSHNNQKSLFNMFVTTDDFVQYCLTSSGMPMPWEGNI
jgi:hypothetical protein